MGNDDVLAWGLLSMVLLIAPLSMLIYTNMTIENGVINWPLTVVGFAVFVSSLIIAYFKVYPTYKGIEEVRTDEYK